MLSIVLCVVEFLLSTL